MKTTLRWILIGLVAVVVLAVGGIAALVLTLDPNTLKPRIEAAVEQATGRQLTLAGPIGFSTSLVPTIVVQDVSLSNIEGGSRPAMLHVGRVELQLALIPLLSQQVDIRSLRLVDPDILLETDREGHPNWVFTAPQRAAPAPTPAAPTQPSAPRSGSSLNIAAITIEGGRFAWHSVATGKTETVQVERLDLRMGSGEQPLALEGRLTFAGTAFALRGRTAPFLGLSPDRPWPYNLEISAAGAELRLEGALARAGEVQDWQARVQGRIAALQALQPLLDAAHPGVVLPPLRDISLDVAMAMQGGVLRPGAVALSIGGGDLSSLREGLSLTKLDIAAPAPDQPIRITGEGRLGQAPLAITGTLGAPAGFLPGAAPVPFPLDVAVTAAGARATLAGRIADPRAMAGAAIDLAVQVPDLAALQAIAGRPLPALGALDAAARIVTGEHGTAGPVQLTGLRIVAPAVALEGELTVATQPHLQLSGRLEGPRLDVDALNAAFAAPPAATAPGPARPAPAPAHAAGPRRMIPAVPLPLDALRLFDAQLRVAVAELRASGITYRDLAGTLALADGRGRLDPFAVTLPGGRIAGTLAADASGETPSLRIALRHDGQGVELEPLLAAYHLPAYAAGQLEFALTLAGRGHDLRALLADADGRLALAMEGGRIERALLSSIPQSLRGLILPPGAEAGVPLRCLAVVAPAQDGVVRTETLLVDSGIGRLGGGGTIRLRDEVISLRLIPDVRLGPVQLRAPVRIGGTLSSPSFDATENAGAAIGAGLGAFLGAQRSPDRTLQGLAQSFGGGPSLPDCGPSLAAARQAMGATPATPANPAAAETTTEAQDPAPAPPATTAPRRAPERAPRPQDLLRGLFGGRR